MNPVYDKVDIYIVDNLNHESGVWQGWQIYWNKTVEQHITGTHIYYKNPRWN